jgi:sulfur carrier protein ThiS
VNGLRITVKLLATYRRYLPPGSKGAYQSAVPPGATVRDLLAQLPLPPADGKVILVNGRGAPPDHILREGDVVAIFPAIAGG